MFWTKDDKPKIHMVGIGGSGMSGIAEVLIASGFPVSGSDMNKSSTIERLESLGAQIYIGHDPKSVHGASCVVVSSAVAKNNPEWQEAAKKGIPVIPRAEMLAELMRLKRGVAVAGSHGKTTTTSMLGQMLQSLRPTVVVGGRLQHWNASSIVGRGSVFVIEADESDRSFLKYTPVYSVVTNIDLEHLDNYKDLEDIKRAFLEFLNRTAFFGVNWINGDCPNLRSLQDFVVKPVKTFGFAADANLRIVDLELSSKGSVFRLELEGQDLGSFELPVVGKHNVYNATGAIGVALSLGLGLGSIRRRLKSFVPADRRLQVHFESEDWAVVEDYAHHPTEIQAALDSVDLMYPGWKKFVIFQPHRFSRTEALWDDFISGLKNRFDLLRVLPIYSAHEAPRASVSSEQLVKDLDHSGADVWKSLPPAPELLMRHSDFRGVFVILGASPLTSFAQGLSSELKRHDAAKGLN